MISINKVEKQLKKMDKVDHVWIKPMVVSLSTLQVEP